jgi:acetyltransferase-like isoleucine patch superfamily enzyme
MPLLLTEQDLINQTWRLYRPDAYVFTECLRFLPDGKLGGYSHTNEHGWKFAEGRLSLLNRDMQATSEFDHETMNAAGVMEITGRSLVKGEHVLRLCPVVGLPKWPDTTRNKLSHEIYRRGWDVGDHTYGVPFIYEPHMGKLTIGKFCSIAAGVAIALGDHAMSNASTYPFATLRQYWPGVTHGGSDHATKGEVVIGNDVWIGADVFITSGVTIGDGAVIGAHAVVTRNIPAYAIAVGNPARVVRYRFDEATIARLLAVRWWELSDDCLNRLMPLLLSPDVSRFIEAVETVRAESLTDSPAPAGG